MHRTGSNRSLTAPRRAVLIAVESWRNQRQQGQLQALEDNKRGRKATIPQPVQKELEQLRQENQRLRLRQKMQQAELIIDIQKKASQLMGISLSPANHDEPD